ncbi:nuclear transport factor 2 family protein [Nocardia sp. NPDC051030]|uniref:nuclear transport factor 2 family protein n=1 Tax=Nocardia sp. NPDC051030 TaxID=3155162 RepID=UPI00341E2950
MSNQEVLDLVQCWAEAELEGDSDAYADLLAPDFIGVGPVGFVLDRTQWAARFTDHGLKYAEFSIIDPDVRTYGDTALVKAVLQQQATVMGQDTSGSFRVVLVVVRQAQRWMIANVQLSGPLIAPGQRPPWAR